MSQYEVPKGEAMSYSEFLGQRNSKKDPRKLLNMIESKIKSQNYNPCVKTSAHSECHCKVTDGVQIEDLKDQNVKLKEQISEQQALLKLFGVEKRRLEQDIVKICNQLKQQECRMAKSCTCGDGGDKKQDGKPQDTILIKALKYQAKSIQDQRDALAREIERLKKSTKASCLNEMKAQIRVLAEELCRKDLVNQELQKQVLESRSTIRRSSRRTQSFGRGSKSPLANIDINNFKIQYERLEDSVQFIKELASQINFQVAETQQTFDKQSQLQPEDLILLQMANSIKQLEICLVQITDTSSVSTKLNNLMKEKDQGLKSKSHALNESNAVYGEDLSDQIHAQSQLLSIITNKSIQEDPKFNKRLKNTTLACNEYILEAQKVERRFPDLVFDTVLYSSQIQNSDNKASNDNYPILPTKSSPQLGQNNSKELNKSDITMDIEELQASQDAITENPSSYSVLEKFQGVDILPTIDEGIEKEKNTRPKTSEGATRSLYQDFMPMEVPPKAKTSQGLRTRPNSLEQTKSKDANQADSNKDNVKGDRPKPQENKITVEPYGKQQVAESGNSLQLTTDNLVKVKNNDKNVADDKVENSQNLSSSLVKSNDFPKTADNTVQGQIKQIKPQTGQQGFVLSEINNSSQKAVQDRKDFSEVTNQIVEAQKANEEILYTDQNTQSNPKEKSQSSGMKQVIDGTSTKQQEKEQTTAENKKGLKLQDGSEVSIDNQLQNLQKIPTDQKETNI